MCEKISDKLMRRFDIRRIYVLSHYCPACKALHDYQLGFKETYWNWNHNVEFPTIMPEMKIEWYRDNTIYRCHYEIIKGYIIFYKDSTHEYSGKVVRLPNIPQKIWKRET